MCPTGGWPAPHSPRPSAKREAWQSPRLSPPPPSSASRHTNTFSGGSMSSSVKWGPQPQIGNLSFGGPHLGPSTTRAGSSGPSDPSPGPALSLQSPRSEARAEPGQQLAASLGPRHQRGAPSSGCPASRLTPAAGPCKSNLLLAPPPDTPGPGQPAPLLLPTPQRCHLSQAPEQGASRNLKSPEAAFGTKQPGSNLS